MPGVLKYSLFTRIKEQFGSAIFGFLQPYQKANETIVRHRCHLKLNHQCLNNKILPISLQIKFPIDTSDRRNLVLKFDLSCLKWRIKDFHKRIESCSEIIIKLQNDFERLMVPTGL